MDNDRLIRDITAKMVRQCALSEILDALCQYGEETDAVYQLAFFLADGLCWQLAAHGNLIGKREAALDEFEALRESETLLDATAEAKPNEHTFARGWFRHLYSGPGELLGMIVGFGDGPCLPAGPHAIRIDLICGLATLAMEQANLIAELSFRGEEPAAAIEDHTQSERQSAWDSETCVQEVMRMMASQATPEEILDLLCQHLGRLETRRQAVFYLLRDGNWTLAAKGRLNEQAEAALKRIDPQRISDSVFRAERGAVGALEATFANGWARHLSSGTGELLGMMVGLCGAPAKPRSANLARIELVCRLATLAIEQTHLMGELAFRADHDALTGLPNRGYYERVLHGVLRKSSRGPGGATLLYVNLDRFRLVNDVIGLITGNRLLEQVGRRFRMNLREGALLARMGGDEFAVVIPGMEKPGDAEAVASRLLQSLTSSFSIADHELYIDASIGIACSKSDSTPASLKREAYVALYEAKRAGKARWVRFHPSMATVSPERLEMEKRLRFALKRREFMVHFQPQIDLGTGRAIGVEALLRWRPEGLGLVSPGAFIPILEEAGLVVEVGRWVLLESCRQAKHWLDKDDLRLRMAVNVSVVQLVHPDFVRHVEEAMAETGLPPELLELELTESLFVGDFEAACRIIGKLQAMGVTMALDDFGTGQSSLSYLHRLPFDRLKIDQSFIRSVRDGESLPPVVQNIIQMADMSMVSIAEGVETAHQAELLHRFGCNEGQGFLYSPARPAAEAAEFCRNFRGEQTMPLDSLMVLG